MIRRAIAGAGGLIALVACGCSGEPEPTDSDTASTRAAESAATTSGAPDEPLALVVHESRDVGRGVSTSAARRLVANGAPRWSSLGLDGGSMHVVAAPGVSSSSRIHVASSNEAAVAAVRTDPSTLAIVPATAVDASVRVLEVAGTSPLRSPSKYPLRSDAGQSPDTVTTVTVVGDIMLGRRVGEQLTAADDPAAVFRPLARRLASADVTVGNLESTLSDAGAPTQGDDSFAAEPSVRRGLRLAGFDVLDVANNHLGDYGVPALRTTLARIESTGVEYVGAGANRAEARTPVVREVDGVRIGFYATDSIGETPGATARSPGTNRLDMPPRTGPLDRAALREISADLRRLDRRVDTVIVMPHWGTQYTHVPEPSQRRAAAAFVRAGADVVAGGHPHWVQPIERAPNAVVAYSLGNFVFDMDFMRKTQEGVFLEIVLWDGEVVSADPVPYVIGDDFAPRIATGARARQILGDLSTR
ncbi:CapA family protein [Nocardioidaceae bacterium SCSIO 66511]|nr:CapA family protein [Nocardioidaceae bacterium SCSIO 66511]